MRGIALGLCVSVVAILASASVNAAPVQQTVPAVGSTTPTSLNDHDGGVIPKEGMDRGFTINPDGGESPANYSGNADQDEDGSDVAIYQGEDDQLPS